MTKSEIIKEVHEEAEKAEIDPKNVLSAEGGEQFKKIQDPEHQVLKRENSQRAKKTTELRKKRLEQYIVRLAGDLDTFNSNVSNSHWIVGHVGYSVYGIAIKRYNDIKIDLSKEFLVELRKNTYHGIHYEDVVDHIAKEELVEKFFCRFYPESYDGEYEMLNEGENWGIDPLEFLSNINTSFKYHKKVDGRTQKVIFHAWMNGNWNKRYVDNSISS
ncbi:hypothetical protein Tco_0905696, partial [Tanacetum coccineum]